MKIPNLKSSFDNKEKIEGLSLYGVLHLVICIQI